MGKGSSSIKLHKKTLKDMNHDRVLTTEQEYALQYLQVNIPVSYYRNSFYLKLFKKYKINPELGVDSNLLESPDLHTLLKDIKEVFDTYAPRITLHAPFMDLSLGSLDQQIRKISINRILKTLDVMAFFKPLSIVVHPYYDHRIYNNNLTDWIDNCVDSCRRLLDKCHEMGIKLMLENTFEPDPFVLAELIHALPGVNFCLDIGHMNVWSKSAYNVWLESLADVVGEIHLHDNHGMVDEHLALGEGNIDWLGILNFISNVLTKMPILTLEPHSIETFWGNLKACPTLVKIWSEQKDSYA